MQMPENNLANSFVVTIQQYLVFNKIKYINQECDCELQTLKFMDYICVPHRGGLCASKKKKKLEHVYINFVTYFGMVLSTSLTLPTIKLF